MIVDRFYSLGVIPFIEIGTADLALPLAETLCEIGLPIMEVTFRIGAAHEIIHCIAKQLPEVLLGAGRVTPTGGGCTGRAYSIYHFIGAGLKGFNLDE